MIREPFLLSTEDPVRVLVLSSLISMAAGLGVVELMGLSLNARLPAGEYIAGAVIGACICLFGFLIDVLIVGVLLSPTEGRMLGVKKLLSYVAFFAGGVSGFIVGNLLSGWIGWTLKRQSPAG